MRSRSRIALVLPLIRILRGQRVIFDFDLARLYGVSTSRLNQQFRRNKRRFPRDFAFILTRGEAASKLVQSATISPGRNWRKPPIAYTEHGVVMAANVLNSERAVTMSVEIVRAFIRLRKAALAQDKLASKVSELERAVEAKLERHDHEIETPFKAIESLIEKQPPEEPARKRIGFLAGSQEDG